MVAILREKSQPTTFEQLMTAFGVNGDQVLRELSTEQVREVLRLSLPVFTYFEKDLCILHLFFRLFRSRDVSILFLIDALFLQPVFKTFNRRSVSMEALPCSEKDPSLPYLSSCLAPFLLS